VERKPSSHVLGIPAVLLKAERAVVPHEDIDAMVARGTVEGCYDSSSHGDSDETSNVAVDPPVQAGEARRNGSGRTAG
jgi:hypothetical protein